MPRRPEDVANDLVESGRACRGESAIYIYTGPGDVGWTSMDSANAGFHISMMLGSMATVNTEVVALPVRRILRTRNLPKIRLPRSVCFNRVRYTIGVECDDEMGMRSRRTV